MPFSLYQNVRITKQRSKMPLPTVFEPQSRARATYDPSPPPEDKDTPCMWCSEIRVDHCRTGRDKNLEQEILQDLFHSDCDCLKEDDLLPKSTCGFCRHLNFNHLYNCLSASDDGFPHISIRWYCKADTTNECQFCIFILSMLQYEDISKFTLEVPGHSASNFGSFYLQGAGVKLSFRVYASPCAQLGDQVDWDRLRTWPMAEFEKEVDLPDGFRVIDVVSNCIVTPSHPVDYVALSYVWGQTSENEIQATLRNIKTLEVEGNLSQIQLPRTIQDAIYACCQLGWRYLWVDRLCILQDDQDSKHGQIAYMDRIFGSALFTIVALTGSNAHSGLAGVSISQRNRDEVFEWQGLKLIEECPGLEYLMRESTWAKRGWTFQEQLCSRRKMYFTDYGVHFFCDEFLPFDDRSECIYPHHKGMQTDESLKGLVEEYTMRSLSFPDDILRACTGVFTKLRSSEHRFGLPFDGFETWIRWQPVDWKHQRRTSPTEVFPSWSWSSAQGGVQIPRTTMYAVALWALPDSLGSGNDEALRWISRDDTVKRLKLWPVLARKPSSTAKAPLDTRDQFGHNTSLSLPMFEERNRRKVNAQPGRVLSVTHVATFNIQHMDYHFSDGRRTFSIRSAENKIIGGIWLSTSSCVDINEDNGIPREKMFEFLALSWERRTDYVKNIISGTGQDETRLDWHIIRYDSSVDVMMILRDEDTGVARRLGVGQVFVEPWFDAKPKLKGVVLE